jgi:hypothetical protein
MPGPGRAAGAVRVIAPWALTAGLVPLALGRRGQHRFD